MAVSQSAGKKHSPRARRESSDKTRERILRAALSEFAARGFSGARMEAIARRAKANKAMIHYYFGNKQQLYRTLLEMVFCFNELEEGLAKEFYDWELSIPQQLYIVLLVLTGMHFDRNSAEQRDVYRLVAWENAEGQSGMHSIAEDFFVPRLQKIADLVIAGIEQGIFAPVHPWLFLYGIVSRVLFYAMQRDVYKGTTIYNQLYGEIDRDTFFRFLSESVFRELSPPERPLPVPQLPESILRKVTTHIEALRHNHLSFGRR